MDVIERGTVQHLASRLKGRLKENLNEWDALTLYFQLLQQLEYLKRKYRSNFQNGRK